MTTYFEKNAFTVYFWPCPATCGISVPRPRIEPAAPALAVLSLNHWTAMDAPLLAIYLAGI